MFPVSCTSLFWPHLSLVFRAFDSPDFESLMSTECTWSLFRPQDAFGAPSPSRKSKIASKPFKLWQPNLATLKLSGNILKLSWRVGQYWRYMAIKFRQPCFSKFANFFLFLKIGFNSNFTNGIIICWWNQGFLLTSLRKKTWDTMTKGRCWV